MLGSQAVKIVPIQLLQSQTKYCCVMINQLRKDLKQLQLESQRTLLLEEEYNSKRDSFLEVSKLFNTKLSNLWSLGDQVRSIDYQKSLQVIEFANKISAAWREGDEVIGQEVQNTQMVSFTTPNMSLKIVLDKIHQNINLAKETVQKTSCHANCVGQYMALYNQIIPLLSRLQDENLTLRYFLSICKAVPYLKELEAVIDSFVTNFSQHVEIKEPPQDIETDKTKAGTSEEAKTNASKDNLTAFPYVVKLLTGEMLGSEQILDHRSIIEPVVKLEVPETSRYFHLPPPGPYGMNNTIADYNPAWYYGCSIPIYNPSIVNGFQQSTGDRFMGFHPTAWQHCYNYLPNKSANTMTSQCSTQVHPISTVVNQQTNMTENTTGSHQQKMNNKSDVDGKINPTIKNKLSEDGNTANNNAVSFVLFRNTEQPDTDKIAESKKKKNTIKIDRFKRPSPTELELFKRRKVIRFVQEPSKEMIDLPPIKMPTLKTNLLKPLA